MAAAKRPPLPVILIANDLLDGDTVFWTGRAWARDPCDALVAQDDETANQLDAVALDRATQLSVVDPYLIDVFIEGGAPVPRHFREKLRTLGPSVRRDLGKQADLRQTADGEI